MKTILFIEDEPTLQRTFGEFLKNAGYNMISALDGETALNLAKFKKPDLILLDLILPKLNGFDVLKRLKENDETTNIPVIILTNLEETENINKAVEFGVKAYLVKTNYTPLEVIEKIKNILK